MIDFTITGVEPLPKQSFRYSKRGGYTDPRIKAWQNEVAWMAREAMVGKDILTGDLRVDIIFTRSNKRRVDLDNLSKAVLDGMNKIVYNDDKTVTELHLYKRFDEVPGLYVRVEEMR